MYFSFHEEVKSKEVTFREKKTNQDFIQKGSSNHFPLGMSFSGLQTMKVVLVKGFEIPLLTFFKIQIALKGNYFVVVCLLNAGFGLSTNISLDILEICDLHKKCFC